MSHIVIEKNVLISSMQMVFLDLNDCFEFSDSSGRILKQSSLESKYDIQWTATLANYFLRELAVNPDYLLDKYSPGREMLGPELEQFVGKNFGDTSIGKA